MSVTDNPRDLIVEIGRRLYSRGYIVATEGNISVRLDDQRLLCTPSGLCKGDITTDHLIVVDMDGDVIEGDRKPSSELKMHLEVYRQRPQINAVVHAHPPTCTGFACAGEPLDKAILSEVVLTLGCVPIAPYGTPSTHQVPASISELVKSHDALLLANHGALTLGPDLWTAYFRMETIEHSAKIVLVTRILGKEVLLSPEKVEELEQVGIEMGLDVPALSVGSCPVPGDDGGRIEVTRSELIDLIQNILSDRK